MQRLDVLTPADQEGAAPQPELPHEHLQPTRLGSIPRQHQHRERVALPLGG